MHSEGAQQTDNGGERTCKNDAPAWGKPDSVIMRRSSDTLIIASKSSSPSAELICGTCERASAAAACKATAGGARQQRTLVSNNKSEETKYSCMPKKVDRERTYNKASKRDNRKKGEGG